MCRKKACAFLRPVKTDVVFRFNVKDDGFEHCDLALETPEIFTVTVNGEEVPKNITGYLHDTAFKTIDIRRYIKTGTNEVRLSCEFSERPETYESIKKSPVFESEKTNFHMIWRSKPYIFPAIFP